MKRYKHLETDLEIYKHVSNQIRCSVNLKIPLFKLHNSLKTITKKKCLKVFNTKIFLVYIRKITAFYE